MTRYKKYLLGRNANDGTVPEDVMVALVYAIAGMSDIGKINTRDFSDKIRLLKKVGRQSFDDIALAAISEVMNPKFKNVDFVRRFKDFGEDKMDPVPARIFRGFETYIPSWYDCREYIKDYAYPDAIYEERTLCRSIRDKIERVNESYFVAAESPYPKILGKPIFFPQIQNRSQRYVYFALALSDNKYYNIKTGDIKIGRSNNPEKRMCELKSTFGVDVELILSMVEGVPFWENELHGIFKSSWIGREWFMMSDEIESFIHDAYVKRSNLDAYVVDPDRINFGYCKRAVNF